MDPSTLLPYLLGSGGAAGLTLLLILTEILVPRAYHRRVLEENDRLRAANDAYAEANAQLRDTNRDLVASGQLTNQVVQGLMSIAQEHRIQTPVAGPPPATQ